MMGSRTSSFWRALHSFLSPSSSRSCRAMAPASSGLPFVLPSSAPGMSRECLIMRLRTSEERGSLISCFLGRKTIPVQAPFSFMRKTMVTEHSRRRLLHRSARSAQSSSSPAILTTTENLIS